jgi:hypothetical protein
VKLADATAEICIEPREESGKVREGRKGRKGEGGFEKGRIGGGSDE